MQLPPGSGFPRPPFPGQAPMSQGARPPFPPGPGPFPGAPPPTGMVGAPMPAGPPPFAPGPASTGPRPLVDQMQKMSLGGAPHMPPPPGAPFAPPGMQQGFMPPPGAPFPPGAAAPPPPGGAPLGQRPPGPPGMPLAGGMPLGGPPPVPSSGTPINMPMAMGPPSTNTAALAGIPAAPAGGSGGLLGMMRGGPAGGSSTLANGPAGGPPRPGFGPMGGPPPPPAPGTSAMPPPPPGVGGYAPPPPPGMGPGGMMPPMPPGMPPGPPGMAPPGPPGPQSAAPPRQAMQNRIDPSQIPRPATVPSEAMVFDTRVGGQHANPPPAASRYVVRDRGSCGPRFMRSTLNQLPFSADLLNNTQMPFAVVVSPMALPDPGDDPVQVVDLGELGPVRCGRCKAYMNPFMRFTNSGRSFVCNFCGCSNNTPDAYYCHLGPDGRRRDADERPELCKGSVEYVATSDYMVRPPMASAHVFLIDVSHSAVSTGATATVCSCISHVLESLQADARTLVGLATYDSSVHFYALRPGASQPQMLVVGDVNEVYAPDGAPVLVGLEANKEAILALLKSIPEMFAQNRITDNCAGAAVEAGIALLKPNGGKVHLFTSALPSLGVHTLKARDAVGVSDKDKLAFLASQDPSCKALASAAADFQISIDVALLSQAYVDVATLSELTGATGGSLYSYAPFNPLMDHDQVLNDLKWNLVRPQALEAVMRVRVSQGLDVQSYLGHYHRQPNNPTDVFLPAIDSDKSILALVSHTEKLAPGTEAYLQAALLYTNVTGQRRIRVHTLALPISDNVSAVFKGADLDAYITHLSRRLASRLSETTLAAARENVTTTIVNTLHAYRKHCAANSSAVQLILPEALKLLPLYALSLLKGPALKDGSRPDDRALWCAHMMSLPAARIAPLLYPRLLPVHQILEGGEEGMAAQGVPEGLVLSSEQLESGGVYLLENGMDALLYVDKGARGELLQELFGASSYDDLCRTPGPLPLLPRDSTASKLLQQLLVKVRIHRSSFLRLRITRKADPAEVLFFNLLVEDRSTAGMSYVEYLCQVHRLIQAKMA